MLGPEALERPQDADAVGVRPSSRRSPAEKLHRRDAPVLPALDPNLKFYPISELRDPSSATFPLETPSTGSMTPRTAEQFTPPTAPSDYFEETWSSRQHTPSNDSRPVPKPPNPAESPRLQKSFQKSSQTPIDLATKPMPALPSESSPTDEEANIRVWKAGHPRSQGHDGMGAVDPDAGSSMSSNGSERHPPQYHRSPVQKTMLSQALSRANSAVQLDNAQDFRGAIEAYEDACQLLHQVMLRSSGNEDRSKLQTIVSKRLLVPSSSQY